MRKWTIKENRIDRDDRIDRCDDVIDACTKRSDETKVKTSAKLTDEQTNRAIRELTVSNHMFDSLVCEDRSNVKHSFTRSCCAHAFYETEKKTFRLLLCFASVRVFIFGVIFSLRFNEFDLLFVVFSCVKSFVLMRTRVSCILLCVQCAWIALLFVYICHFYWCDIQSAPHSIKKIHTRKIPRAALL